MRRSWIVGAVVACAALLAACSSGPSGSTASSGGAADIAGAQAQIDKYSATPQFTAPGPAFDARAAMAGKTIASIPVNSGIDFTQFYRAAGERIAGKVGFTFTTWQNQGSPSQWAQGVDAALAAKANLIELFAGINPSQVQPQMIQAQRAAVPVVAADNYDLTQKPADGLKAAINCPCSEAARLMADWVTVKTNGTANVLVVTSSDITPSEANEAALKDELGKRCPGCTAKYIDIPSKDWATAILPQVQSALVADPKINYVLPIFDTMSIWATQAITQANRVGSVHIATYNGTPSILKLMGESDIIEMNVGQSNDWMAHTALDQQMRVLAGLPTNPDATWGLRIWTKANLKEAGSPPTDSQGYGDAYQVGFAKLWGLS